MKIKLREILEYRIYFDANGIVILARYNYIDPRCAIRYISLIRENCIRENFENANPRKLCASKIWRYTRPKLIIIALDRDLDDMYDAGMLKIIKKKRRVFFFIFDF